MHIITASIARALDNENWFAALFMSLTLPGVCAGIEHGNDNELDNYSQWFDDYLKSEYGSMLSGHDCYLLQQSCLYKQLDYKHLESVERFHFLLPSDQKYQHKVYVNGVLQLDIKQFCQDITNAFERWIQKLKSSSEAKKRLEHLTTVTEKLVN